MNKSRRVLLPAVVALCMSPAFASAQRTQADSLKALIETLFTDFMFGSGRPTLRLAAFPARFPEIALPAGAGVLGSIEFPRMSMTLVRGGTAEEVVVELRESLEKRGWNLRRGQALTAFARPGEDATVLCSSDGLLSLGTADPQNVLIIHSDDPGFLRSCEDVSPSGRARDRQPLPHLDPPPAARAEGGGSSGGPGTWDMSTRLRTELSPRQILDHYVTGIRAAGATFGEVKVLDTVATVPFTIVDERDVQWRGTMTVIVTGPDTRNVYVELRRI